MQIICDAMNVLLLNLFLPYSLLLNLLLPIWTPSETNASELSITSEPNTAKLYAYEVYLAKPDIFEHFFATNLCHITKCL